MTEGENNINMRKGAVEQAFSEFAVFLYEQYRKRKQEQSQESGDSMLIYKRNTDDNCDKGEL